MVDGPHKTLNMRSHWKAVARLADNKAYGNDEVVEVVSEAYWRDLDRVSAFVEKVEAVLSDPQGSILPNHKEQQLQALRPLTGGNPLAARLLDSVQRRLSQRVEPLAALQGGLEDSLAIHGSAVGRQIEEHYRRESTSSRSHNVRARIEAAVGGISLSDLARRLTSSGQREAATSGQGRKRDGLDEGPGL